MLFSSKDGIHELGLCSPALQPLRTLECGMDLISAPSLPRWLLAQCSHPLDTGCGPGPADAILRCEDVTVVILHLVPSLL